MARATRATMAVAAAAGERNPLPIMPRHQMEKKMRRTHFPPVAADDLASRIDPLLLQYHCPHQCSTISPTEMHLPYVAAATTMTTAVAAAATTPISCTGSAGLGTTMSGTPQVMGTGGATRSVPLEMHYYRKPAMVVSIIDGIFATSLLVFHGLTLMIQEIPEDRSAEDNWLLPRIPMTPGELTITGYMEVIAWIGILGVNFSQLLVAVGLFNGCDKNTEALKAFESTRVYIKTTIFIITILLTKLCILYFMHRMDMYAVGTVIFTTIETIFHLIALIVVFKFFHEIKTNYPTITEIYLTPAEDSSPKINPVSDAVWF